MLLSWWEYFCRVVLHFLILLSMRGSFVTKKSMHSVDLVTLSFVWCFNTSVLCLGDFFPFYHDVMARIQGNLVGKGPQYRLNSWIGWLSCLEEVEISKKGGCGVVSYEDRMFGLACFPCDGWILDTWTWDGWSAFVLKYLEGFEFACYIWEGFYKPFEGWNFGVVTLTSSHLLLWCKYRKSVDEVFSVTV